MMKSLLLITSAFNVNEQTTVVRGLLCITQRLSVVFPYKRLGLVLQAVGLEDQSSVQKLSLVPAERLSQHVLLVSPALGC